MLDPNLGQPGRGQGQERDNKIFYAKDASFYDFCLNFSEKVDRLPESEGFS